MVDSYHPAFGSSSQVRKAPGREPGERLTRRLGRSGEEERKNQLPAPQKHLSFIRLRISHTKQDVQRTDVYQGYHRLKWHSNWQTTARLDLRMSAVRVAKC